VKVAAAEAKDEESIDDIGTYSDPEKQVEKVLEGLLGREVEDLEQGDKELRNTLGEEEYAATMKNLESNLIAAAKDGKVNNAGVVKDGELNVELEGVERERKKRAAQVNPKEVTKLEDITGEDRDLSDESNLGRKQLQSFLNSTGSNTTFNDSLKGDMQDLMEEENGEENVRQLLGELYQKNKDAAKNINDSVYGGNFDLENIEVEDGDEMEEVSEPEGGPTPGGEGPGGGGGGPTGPEGGAGGAEESEIIEPGEVTSGGSGSSAESNLGDQLSDDVDDLSSQLNETKSKLSNLESSLESTHSTYERGHIDESTYNSRVSERESEIEQAEQQVEAIEDKLTERLQNIRQELEQKKSRLESAPMPSMQSNIKEEIKDYKQEVEDEVKKIGDSLDEDVDDILSEE